jgi:phospholipid transport system substrate-binding protein
MVFCFRLELATSNRKPVSERNPMGLMMKILPRRGRFSRVLKAWGLAALMGFAGLGFASLPAAAASPAESYVQDNIHKGLELLNNRALSTEQRRSQFETFLLGLTDMKRIADFTLGQYRRGASPADVAAFDAAFQSYAVAVYQSYFEQYKGQTLKVTGSQERAPQDFIVDTQLIDPNDHSGQAPLVVEFRVRTDTGKPVVIDFSVAGIWLAIEERDQFTSFLGQNGGNIAMLNGHLNDLAKQYK